MTICARDGQRQRYEIRLISISNEFYVSIYTCEKRADERGYVDSSRAPRAHSRSLTFSAENAARFQLSAYTDRIDSLIIVDRVTARSPLSFHLFFLLFFFCRGPRDRVLHSFRVYSVQSSLNFPNAGVNFRTEEMHILTSE